MNAWVLGIAMAAGLSAHAEDCNVIVKVYSGPDRDFMLQRAENLASTMFRDIGVEIEWRRGASPLAVADSACGAPIVLKLDAAADRQVGVPAISLAYTLPFGESGPLVHVFMDRVERRRDPYFSTVVLAHVLVHEITHAIQQVNRHSPDGIMKAGWNEQDYARMRSHPLSFAEIDVQLIHLGIAKRSQQAVTE